MCVCVCIFTFIIMINSLSLSLSLCLSLSPSVSPSLPPPLSLPVPPPTTADTLQATGRFFGEEVDLNIGVQGVDVTVWGIQGDFSAMGYVVDHLDLLIDEWFPGIYGGCGYVI